MIRIAIADDHELIREGLKKVAIVAGDVQVVGEANSLDGALELLRTTAVDVLVLDLSLASLPDLQALQTVREAFPSVPVLVLSIHPEELYAVAALKAGAAGYVCKSMAADEVIGAIHKVAQGGHYVSPLTAELLAKDLSNPVTAPAHERLTQREFEVFQMLGAGMPVKQVAAQLGLSISSVNTYRARIFLKMDLRSNAALIRYAVQHGLTD